MNDDLDILPIFSVFALLLSAIATLIILINHEINEGGYTGKYETRSLSMRMLPYYPIILSC